MASDNRNEKYARYQLFTVIRHILRMPAYLRHVRKYSIDPDFFHLAVH
jgi:hypothetical protein